jgi:Rha family phage regulatory protein
METKAISNIHIEQNTDGQLVVSSRQVAEHFEKRHADVLAGIENIKTENSAVTPMFCETTYTAGTGKAYKEYLMNRDGFMLLVMSFTGKKALEWKIKYIEAFNAMEKALKQQSPSYLLEDPIERAKRWIEEQQEKKLALAALEESKPKVATYDALVSNEGYVGLREMAKMLGYPVNKMGAYVCEIGMCYKQGSIYYPYAQFNNNGMCVGKWHKAKWTSKGGMKTVWSLEGVEYVRKSLERIGFYNKSKKE